MWACRRFGTAGLLCKMPSLPHRRRAAASSPRLKAAGFPLYPSRGILHTKCLRHTTALL